MSGPTDDPRYAKDLNSGALIAKDIKTLQKHRIMLKQIKELLTTLGIQYIDAPYDADEICAKLMIDKN